MTNAIPFPYAADGKRYHTWNCHLRQTFGQNVFKVALDGRFDCPNRDGTVTYGDCTFCSAARSGDFGPMWSVNKWGGLNAIDAELKRRDSFQGKRREQGVANAWPS